MKPKATSVLNFYSTRAIKFVCKTVRECIITGHWYTNNHSHQSPVLEYRDLWCTWTSCGLPGGSSQQGHQETGSGWRFAQWGSQHSPRIGALISSQPGHKIKYTYNAFWVNKRGNTCSRHDSNNRVCIQFIWLYIWPVFYAMLKNISLMVTALQW